MRNPQSKIKILNILLKYWFQILFFGSNIYLKYKNNKLFIFYEIKFSHK